MKCFFFLVVITSFTNCTSQDNLTSDIKTNQVIELTAIKHVANTNTLINKGLFFSDSIFRQVDTSSIHILLANNDTLTLENVESKHDETQEVKYEFKGFNKLTKLYWISKKKYEEEENLLVSYETGEMFKIWNRPVLNPNGKYILTKQNDCFLIYDDCPSGFQLWELNGPEVALIETVELNGLYVKDIIWQSDKEAIVIIGTIEGLLENGGEDIFYRLRVK